MFEISAGAVKSPPKFSGVSGNFSKPIPPSGTSARKAYEKTVKQGTGAPKTTAERLTGTYDYPVKSTISGIVGSSSSVKRGGSPRRSGTPSDGSGGSGDSGGSGGSSPVSAKSALKYYEAPIAEKYGFSKTTAYQEALANTAYRREMADMRKAGLNPSVIYGSHNSSGADSGIRPVEDYSFGGYGGSGGAGGSGRRYRGGNSGKYVFSGGAYYGIMAGVGAITAIATKNVGAGMAAAGIAGTAMKALNGFLKK